MLGKPLEAPWPRQCLGSQNKNLEERETDGRKVQGTHCPCRGLRLGFQHPHILFWFPQTLHTYGALTYVQTKHPHT